MLRLYAAKLMSIQTRVHAVTVTSDGLDAARAVESITAGQADSTHIMRAHSPHSLEY
jgi:hypothetical protein